MRNMIIYGKKDERATIVTGEGNVNQWILGYPIY
jgi:hypothetical protein